MNEAVLMHPIHIIDRDRLEPQNDAHNVRTTHGYHHPSSRNRGEECWVKERGDGFVGGCVPKVPCKRGKPLNTSSHTEPLLWAARVYINSIDNDRVHGEKRIILWRLSPTTQHDLFAAFSFPHHVGGGRAGRCQAAEAFALRVDTSDRDPCVHMAVWLLLALLSWCVKAKTSIIPPLVAYRVILSFCCLLP